MAAARRRRLPIWRIASPCASQPYPGGTLDLLADELGAKAAGDDEVAIGMSESQASGTSLVPSAAVP